MRSVREPAGRRRRRLHAGRRRSSARGPGGAACVHMACETESLVLDVVYVLGVIVLFVVVGLVAKAVEKL